MLQTGVRMNHAEIGRLVGSHRRPGFYISVLEEGEIAPGIGSRKSPMAPERMTVEEIDALLYTPEHSFSLSKR